MKISIEIADHLTEDEVIIKCRSVDTTIQKIQQYILEQTSSLSKLAFFKENEEYFFPLDDILFFETSGEKVCAYTSNDMFFIKYRLYELEQLLPKTFVRISKSAILNINHVYSVQRNLTSSSLVTFHNSHRQIYVSRSYYKPFKQRLDERSQL